MKLREEKDLKDTYVGKNELFEADLLKSIVIQQKNDNNFCWKTNNDNTEAKYKNIYQTLC